MLAITRVLATAGAALFVSAAPALAGSPDPFSITLGPTAVAGAQHSTATFTILDSGKTALSLRMQAMEQRPVKGQPGIWQDHGTYRHAVITPERFTLKPGQSRHVKVAVNSRDGYYHRLAIEAVMLPPKANSGAVITRAFGVKYIVKGLPNPYAVPVGQPGSHGPNLWRYAAYAGLAFLAAGACIGLALRRRHRQAQRRRQVIW